MFSNVIASAGEIVNGTYAGGASANDPVPVDVSYYGTEWTYMALMFALFCVMIFAVTRLNADR